MIDATADLLYELPITNQVVSFVGPRQQASRTVDTWARDVEVMVAATATPQILAGAVRYQYVVYWDHRALLGDKTMPQNGDFLVWSRYPQNDRIALKDIVIQSGAFGETFWRAFILPIEAE